MTNPLVRKICETICRSGVMPDENEMLQNENFLTGKKHLILPFTDPSLTKGVSKQSSLLN